MNIAVDEIPNAKKVDPKPSSKSKDNNKGRDDKDAGCWRCGSKSHWIRDCPQPEPSTQQPTKPSGSGASSKTKASSRTPTIRCQQGTAIRNNLKQDSKGRDATKKVKTTKFSKRRPSAKGLDVEESDTSDNEESETKESEDESEESAKDEGEEKPSDGPEATSLGPDSPENEKAEARMANCMLGLMKKFHDDREAEKMSYQRLRRWKLQIRFQKLQHNLHRD